MLCRQASKLHGRLLVPALNKIKTCATVFALSVLCGCGASEDSEGHPRTENPFAGSIWYTDPVWQSHALSEPGGAQVAHESTSVWIESEQQLTRGLGDSGLNVKEHLDAALMQGADLVTIVLANAANSDCASIHPHSGRFTSTSPSVDAYKERIINPIAEIFSSPTYKSLKIVVVLEPHTLPHLVTHPTDCDNSAPGSEFDYFEQIQYALDHFWPLENVYVYLDIGNSGLLGDERYFEDALTLYKELLQNSTHGFESIHGLASNLEGYAPLNEPFLDLSTTANDGRSVSESGFYLHARHLGELEYARAFRDGLIALGAPTTLGIIIDTSRNGWGGPDRPAAQAVDANIDGLVDASRIDRRSHRRGRCNQNSGFGERPRSDPSENVHAYFWGYPGGWSQGVSVPDFFYSVEIMDEYGISQRRYPAYCDPTSLDVEGMEAYPDMGEFSTNALPGAPWRGMWFSEGFATFLRNAYPPIE